MLQIAKILKSNGTCGEIIMGFRNYAPEDLDIKKPVFLYFDGLPVPFFIHSFEIKGRKAFVRLYGIDSLSEAEEIKGKDINVDYEIDSDKDEYTSIIGWSLYDDSGNLAGEITGYEDIPGNPCLYVKTASDEVMIPFHEDLIDEIDYENESLHYKIPEGLI